MTGKRKKKRKAASLVRDLPDMTFNVLSLRFSDGYGVDIPYQAWKPRQSINLPGRWVKDEEK